MPTPRKPSEKDPFSRLTSKLLLQGIDDSGGPGVFRNKAGEKKTKVRTFIRKAKSFWQ
jgi:predicted secreted protein